MDIQACVPAALCVLHNLINCFDPEEYNQLEFDWVLMQLDELDELDDIPIADNDNELVIQEGNEMECANQ